jgi:hypothetical protein
MSLHEQCVGATDEWYTPSYIFDALGEIFDLDVASPGRDVTPWIPAREFLTVGGLDASWSGFVWMNPPFGARNGLIPWLEKFQQHGSGICLVPDRTSAPWWQAYAPRMDAILFVSPKIRFIDAMGKPGASPAQGTCLMAACARGTAALENAASRLGSLMTPRKEQAP